MFNQKESTVIYTNINTYYITSGKNSRLVRYDVIEMDSETYLVKIWDDQQRGISPPSHIVEIETKKITQEEYKKFYNIGGLQSSVKTSPPPTLDEYVRQRCQEHRNSLID